MTEYIHSITTGYHLCVSYLVRINNFRLTSNISEWLWTKKWIGFEFQYICQWNLTNKFEIPMRNWKVTINEEETSIWKNPVHWRWIISAKWLVMTCVTFFYDWMVWIHMNFTVSIAYISRRKKPVFISIRLMCSRSFTESSATFRYLQHLLIMLTFSSIQEEKERKKENVEEGGKQTCNSRPIWHDGIVMIFV